MVQGKNELEISFVLPTFNERKNIIPLLNELLELSNIHKIEIIVVDDNSTDNTSSLVRESAKKDLRIRLINRLGRSGLSSAIKEGCLNATGEIIAIMDTDGQHEVRAIIIAIQKLLTNKLDLVFGSRFIKESSVKGLSQEREELSILANKLARITLSKNYRHLTDFMSGCIVLKRETCLSFIKKVDVNGFKFLYELLAISRGKLKVGETPLFFQPRRYGVSKLDVAIIWDFLVSLIHTLFRRIFPRKAISFALVGAIGVFVQLCAAYGLMTFSNLNFEKALPFAVVVAACSNFLINNWLTFSSNRLRNKALLIGLFQFLLVSSLPIFANVGLATFFYSNISENTLLSQIAGIVVVFIWNYAASSRLVWNN